MLCKKPARSVTDGAIMKKTIYFIAAAPCGGSNSCKVMQISRHRNNSTSKNFGNFSVVAMPTAFVLFVQFVFVYVHWLAKFQISNFKFQTITVFVFVFVKFIRAIFQRFLHYFSAIFRYLCTTLVQNVSLSFSLFKSQTSNLKSQIFLPSALPHNPTTPQPKSVGYIGNSLYLPIWIIYYTSIIYNLKQI